MGRLAKNYQLQSGSNAIQMPTGPETEGPQYPIEGQIRFNSTNNNLEVYGNNQWNNNASSATLGSIYSKVNDDGVPLVKGTPIYSSALGLIRRADATGTGTAWQVLGLVAETSIPITNLGNIQTSEILTATTTQWDVVTGQVGGLTEGSIYYLDPVNPGKLTTTAPTITGQYLIIVGYAVSLTQLSINIQRMLLL